MKQIKNLYGSYLALVFLFILCSCNNNENKYPQSYDYTPSINPPRKLYKLYKQDLDKDGQYEFIVLSVNKDESDTSSNFFDFDRVELFHWNEKENNYEKIMIDTVYFGTKIEFKDIDGDKKEEILLTTNSGGEDDVNSIGLKIYRIQDKHKANKIFDSETGLPVLLDFDADGIPEIQTQRILYNKISGLKNIIYINNIFKIDNKGTFIESTSLFSKYIRKLISEDSSKYFSKKNVFKKDNSEDQGDLLFSFVKMILGNNLIHESSLNNSLWESEKQFLKSSLKKEQFFDLVNILQNENIEISDELESIAGSLVKDAEEYIKKKDYKGALKFYDEFLNIFPDNFEAYIKTGEIYFALKDYNESVNYYLQAMLFSVNDKRIFLGLGKSFKELKDYKQSKLYFTKYLQYDSVSTDGLMVKNILKLKVMQ